MILSPPFQFNSAASKFAIIITQFCSGKYIYFCVKHLLRPSSFAKDFGSHPPLFGHIILYQNACAPLQDELAFNVHRTAVHHGHGTVRGDRGGGENISEAILIPV